MWNLQSRAQWGEWAPETLADDLDDDDALEDDDEDELPDEDDDEERAELLYRPAPIEFRPSPVCAFAPAVRALAERHRQDASDLLNVSRGALDDDSWIDVRPDPWLRPPSLPVTQRIWLANVLADDAEFSAVAAEVAAYRGELLPALASTTGDEPRAEFLELEHHVRDFRLLIALAGCRRDLVWARWWHGQIWQFDRCAELKAFYGARDRMRARDPEERAAARARDAKRRTTKRRKEYLAEYAARPEAKAKRAALEASPERKAKQAAAKRAKRAAAKRASEATPEVAEAAE